MKKINLFSALSLLICSFTLFTHISAFDEKLMDIPLSPAVNADWLIIGAGPAGILAVGLLLDAGVDQSQIIWIDPEFEVGRLGKYYTTVPANSPTRLFLMFINACNAFQECNSLAMQYLKNLDPEVTTTLGVIVEPLKDITKFLCSKVLSLRTTVTTLDFSHNIWFVGTADSHHFSTNHVILATGSHPRTLGYLKDQQIPLDLAFNREILAQEINNETTVGIVGDSHSAMLILKYLTEQPTGRIINFFKKKLTVAQAPGDSGLLGITGQWVQDVLLQNPPTNLVRIKSTPESLEIWTKICNKIIYAIGYEPNTLPLINGQTTVTYNAQTGEVVQRIFGFGIAFPQHYIPQQENNEVRPSIGLHLFVQYIQKMLPQWLQSKMPSTRHLLPFDDVFRIDVIRVGEITEA